MAKRGPKRKRNVARFKCGKVDRITPPAELIARRIAAFTIAGVKADSKVDIRLGECWLGVLFAAGVIDQQQYDAGNNYHKIYKACLPQGFSGSTLDPDAPRIGNAIWQDSNTFNCRDDVVEAWQASEKVLSGLGRRCQAVVKSICVYDRFERFIDVSSPRQAEAWRADAIDRTMFVAGLDALAIAYGYRSAPQLERAA